MVNKMVNEAGEQTAEPRQWQTVRLCPQILVGKCPRFASTTKTKGVGHAGFARVARYQS